MRPTTVLAERGGHVRSFRAEDLDAVVSLRRRIFSHSERGSVEALTEYCSRIFCPPRVTDGQLGSLVYEDQAEQVVGFLGVVERPMRWGDRLIRVAVFTQLMVAPEHRGLAGRALVRALLAGPQELTLSDVANDVARRLWVSLGGECATFHTFSWTDALRPWRHQANEVVTRGAGRVVRAAMFAARPLMHAGDAMQAAPPRVGKGTSVGAIDPAVMAEAADVVLAGHTLRPAYTTESLTWLLAQLREKHQFGELEGGIVRDVRQEVAGWFLYYRNDGGECEVIQVAAHPTQRALVLGHLRDHARARGAAALTGRIDPSFLQELALRQVTLRHEGAWVLFHTTQPPIGELIRRGDAFLSRLDGEWWMSF